MNINIRKPSTITKPVVGVVQIHHARNNEQMQCEYLITCKNVSGWWLTTILKDILHMLVLIRSLKFDRKLVFLVMYIMNI